MGQLASVLMSIVLLLVLMGALYAFMILPQQRRMKAHQALLRELDAGDVVVTNSGIYGAIIEVDDEVVWLEVAPDIELKFSKSSIAERVDDEDDDDEDDDDTADVDDRADDLDDAEVLADADVDDSDA